MPEPLMVDLGLQGPGEAGTEVSSCLHTEPGAEFGFLAPSAARCLGRVMEGNAVQAVRKAGIGK